MPIDNRTARTRHPDAVAVDAAVHLAGVFVLNNESFEITGKSGRIINFDQRVAAPTRAVSVDMTDALFQHPPSSRSSRTFAERRHRLDRIHLCSPHSSSRTAACIAVPSVVLLRLQIIRSPGPPAAAASAGS